MESISTSLHPMEKSSLSYRRHITRTGLACVIGVCLPHTSPPLAAQKSVVQRELERRAANASKAYELLKTGDAAYEKKDYKVAVQDYAQAFTLMPNGSKTEEIRVIAAVRYATAATERARKLAKGGDYNAARNLLDTVLKPEVSPTHLGALKLREQIEDPTRYNHALTPEHVRDAAKAGRELRIAEGFFNLGQYDKALDVYQSVLRIDPYNRAARRGMERVATAKSDYYRSAQDHTRAELLSQVDKQWELAIPHPEGTALPLPLSNTEDLAPDIRDRLAGITIPVVDLDGASLAEAIDFIRIQSRLGDAPGPNGEKTGINIILNSGPQDSEVAQRINGSRINLKLSNVPLAKILDYITDQTRTQWRTDGVGILITPIGSVDGTLFSRTFRVPPNFLSSAGTPQQEEETNIFDNDSDDRDGGLLPSQVSITDFLKQNGISFPEGASASYTASSNSLTVRNTQANIDLIDQLVEQTSNAEPVQVAVQVTIMRVSEEHIRELGFDWALSPVGLGGALTGGFLTGGSVGNGTAIEQLVDPIIPDFNLSPITSGNRSGDGLLTGDTIDTFIAAPNTGAVAGTGLRAPGILTLTYVGGGAQVQLMMRGLDQKTGADIVVNPSTILRSGERSKIEVIREFIYPSEYEPPEIPDDALAGGDDDDDDGVVVGVLSSPAVPITPSHPTAFVTRNVGVTLEVETTVGPNKKLIDLSLSPELVEFDGFINYGTPITGSTGSTFGIDAAGFLTIIPGQTGELTENLILTPVFSTIRTPNASLTVQDGHTVVLGGVMTSRRNNVEDKTPILGDIPYAGRLFRSEAEETFNEAVIISVKADIIDPTGKPWRER